MSEMIKICEKVFDDVFGLRMYQMKHQSGEDYELQLMYLLCYYTDTDSLDDIPKLINVRNTSDNWQILRVKSV